jgi:hypothetical protein
MKIKFCFFLAGIVFFSLYSCNDFHRNSSHQDVSSASIQKGQELALKYCQSCHLLPAPSQADAKSWENGILPEMGPRLGIFHFKEKNYPSGKNDLSMSQGFYPSKPLLSDEEWQHILDYYTSLSPDTISLVQNRPHPIQKNLSLFSPVIPDFHYHVPATCYVKIDSSSSEHRVVMSDAFRKMVYTFNKDLVLTDSVNTRGPVVDIEIQKKSWLTCNIGVLNPNNGKFGDARIYDLQTNDHMQADSLLFDGLRRPVQVVSADLNKDGKMDYIICEFGYIEGALSWMENKGNGKFERHVLRPVPGAIKVFVQDYNHDGLPDIWALFAQGDESIVLFTNKGNGEFLQEQVLRFPPIFGSSSFELDDFNGDGYPDILYTCGDNADYSTILKPYHGVYIFLNDGKNHFAQKYFFPINGCYKAIARDFDNDGDLDIATIAYFADYQHQPEEGFVYLENKGNFDFMPYSLPQAEMGRWLTMDAGDYDGDGKVDLILGNFSVAPSFVKSKIDWKNFPPFMILKNTGKKN